ncbi:MAG: UDP-N-acetylmuramate dehydrogenase [Desulfuromonadales bacterium]|nr:UDP-N-acetylmuramate dehydrogenase [Desulfuromonadales bacterium]
MSATLTTQLRNAVDGTIETDVALSRYTTWKVGGRADWLITPRTIDGLEKALTMLRATGVPWLVVGGGSNLLVKDGGFRGAVITMHRLRTIDIRSDGQVQVEAGATLAQVIKKGIKAGWGGLESLAGIPGTIGGATVMNAGADGMELGRVIREVQLYNGEDRQRWSHDQCGFSYRSSAFQRDSVVTVVTLALTVGEPAQLETRYKERLAARRETHPYGLPNAGSVFKNPPGKVAWRMIDAVGLRGARRGDAQISPRHTNFIVNLGGARAADILALIEFTRKRVAAEFDVELETEVKIVGEDG